MFLAGIRKLDRVRGDGWLDCPHCHEHAAQDVVDEMRFAALSFYRFTPIARRRVLRCRRCGYRRQATAEELATLNTSGKRVARAWLAPIGLSPLIAALIAVLAITLRSGSASSTGVTYSTVSAVPVAPVSLSIPADYNRSVIAPESSADPGIFVAGSGTLTIRLRRYPESSTALETLHNHFNDDVGLNAGSFPDTPPAPDSTTVAGQQAEHVSIPYTQTGGEAQLDIYTFIHGGVPYELSFQALSTSGIADLKTVEPQILSSLKFNGNETPFASPSASSSASSSSSSSSSSGSPTASPSP